MSKVRLNRKGRQVLTALVIIFIIIIMLAVFIGIKLYEKYSPTKERMHYEDYFEMLDPNEVLVYMNDEPLEIDVIYEDGRCYLPRTYVVENLNCRFYRNAGADFVMFTVADNIYSFATNEAYYTDMNGATVTTDYVIVKSRGDELYIAVDYVKQYADFIYRFYEEPSRLFMWNEYPEKTYATLTKDTAIRFRGGIKSPIIADGTQGQEVEVLQDLEDWIEVRTEDGYLGYVVSKYVSETYTRAEVSTFVEMERPQSTSVPFKVNLGFQAVGAAVGAEVVKDALSTTTGINVISPTWYELADNSGNIRSFANKSYVEQCHKLGVQVWPLITDFDTSLDKTAIFGNPVNRKNLIDRLISDAAQYGFDGINLDFEKLTQETAPHYLQFIRELSFECRKNNIILSTDIYVPASFNMFYNRTEQGIWTDYVIIMGYDEHWSGCAEAGPVASIGYVRDGIVNTLNEVPVEKVINAMPYYVRIWTETKNSDGSVSMTDRAVSMSAARKLLDDNKVPIMWDDETCLYYGSYDKDNATVKIWLEDERSIEEKMKLYKEYDLAGVAGWRIGLEKRAVWSVIERYLN